ncbi:Kinesin-like protein NACK2 [Capsicum chinense]|nr:Kinesin-like protein NACK2 [Capsicum chinense]
MGKRQIWKPGEKILQISLKTIEFGLREAMIAEDEPQRGKAHEELCDSVQQEREYLAKRVRLKLIEDEREMFYVTWDTAPESKQRRRLQVASELWSDPLNTQNVSEGAEVVTKLDGFRESGEHVSAQFCFRSRCDKKTWLG